MKSDSSTLVSVVTTTSNEIEILNQISSTLLEAKLAACIQISGPITSHYVWEGQSQTGTEWQANIKTISLLTPQVVRTIKRLHNYDLPEIITTEVQASHEYSQWVEHQVNS